MSSSKPDILLIPGSAHDQGSLRLLRSALEKRGYTVLAPEPVCFNCEPPTKTLLDDIHVFKSALESAIAKGRDVVVVGHSAGAINASATVAGLEKTGNGKAGVVGLVMMSGMVVPKAGLTIRDVFGKPPFEIEEGEYIRVSPDFVRQAFYADVAPELAEPEIAKIKHMPLGYWITKVPTVPWDETKTTLPITYISFTEDTIFPPEVQKGLYGAIPGVQVKEVKAGHMGVLSQPEKTAEAVDEVVKAL